MTVISTRNIIVIIKNSYNHYDVDTYLISVYVSTGTENECIP